MSGEKKFLTVTKEAFRKACVTICDEKAVKASDLQLFPEELLCQTLVNLVDYFEQQGVSHEKERDAISTLKAELQDEDILVVDMLSTLMRNIEAIPPGWFSRGLVYQSFMAILTLPRFQATTLHRQSLMTIKSLKKENQSLRERLEREVGLSAQSADERQDLMLSARLARPSLFAGIPAAKPAETVITTLANAGYTG